MFKHCRSPAGVELAGLRKRGRRGGTEVDGDRAEGNGRLGLAGAASRCPIRLSISPIPSVAHSPHLSICLSARRPTSPGSLGQPSSVYSLQSRSRRQNRPWGAQVHLFIGSTAHLSHPPIRRCSLLMTITEGTTTTLSLQSPHCPKCNSMTTLSGFRPRASGSDASLSVTPTKCGHERAHRSR